MVRTRATADRDDVPRDDPAPVRGRGRGRARGGGRGGRGAAPARGADRALSPEPEVHVEGEEAPPPTFDAPTLQDALLRAWGAL